MGVTEMLTDQERSILRGGFQGPRPGSNAFPLLELKKDGVTIPGERIDALIRSGVLFGVPIVEKDAHTIRGGDAGPYGEIPDVDLSFSYRLSVTAEQET